MSSPQNRFFDDLAKLMQNAAGMADGARREVEDFLKGPHGALARRHGPRDS